MNKSKQLYSLFITICLLTSLSAKQPNIVLIMSDDMGYSDIGCYGGEIETPNLDQLAETGLRFSQFYNTSRCCPTRAALLTGVYPHQTGMGLMTNNLKQPGYQGEIGKHVVTIAESLGQQNYRCYLSGKWHVARDIAPEGPKYNWPRQRGFDKFYGTIIGAGSFYDPATLCRDNTYITPENDSQYQPDTFYYTDAISDNAVMFLQQHQQETKTQPYFLYVAYTAAHWPMHALPEDIKHYHGKYDQGFTPIRKARLNRLKELGLISAETQLSDQVADWDKVKHQEWEARNMEVYAAMITSMDRGIGRIVQQVKQQGDFENTLILFLQDNGGCAEGFGRRTPGKPYRTDYRPLGKDGLQTKIWPPMQTRDGRAVRVGPDVMAGAEDTFIAYGQGWANVSNTPFQYYKHYAHEGGISTPLIAYWPENMPEVIRGTICHQPGHVIDIMATCLTASGGKHPSEFNSHAIIPLEGVSLTPAFQGKPIPRKDAIYFEHHLNGAIRDGDWKLVRTGQLGKNAKVNSWQLYNMQHDRSELHDLSQQKPEMVGQLAAKWEAWAQRANIKPWPWKVNESAASVKN